MFLLGLFEHVMIRNAYITHLVSSAQIVIALANRDTPQDSKCNMDIVQILEG